MPLEPPDAIPRIKLERIIKTQVRTLIDRGEYSPSGNPEEVIPTVSEEILSALDELPDNIRQEFIRTWFSSQLPLDPETILPLLDRLQQMENPLLQQRLITAAAFLMEQNLPVRQFFLRPLAAFPEGQGEIVSPEMMTEDMETFLEELIQTVSGDNSSQQPADLISLLDKLPENLNELLGRLFNLSTGEAGGKGEEAGLSAGENQLLSSLMGMKLLNLAGEIKGEGLLKFYLEWPPLNMGKEEEGRLILRICSRDKRKKGAQKEESITSYSVSFLITLEKGEVIRADTNISVDTEAVRLFLSTENEDTADTARNNEYFLKESLEARGFNLREFKINVRDEIDRFSLRREIMTGKSEEISGQDGDMTDLLEKYRQVDFRA